VLDRHRHEEEPMGYTGGAGEENADRVRRENDRARLAAEARERIAAIEANKPENIPTAVVGGRRT
jgi:hypothetical protein